MNTDVVKEVQNADVLSFDSANRKTEVDKQSVLNVVRVKTVIAILAAIVFITISQELSTSDQLKWTLWLSFGIVALSLSFIWGNAGIFSFGQNALFGIGAYAYAVISLNLFPITGESFSAFLVAGVAGAIFAALLGYVMFYGRVGDVYLSVLTLAVTLILYTVMSSTAGPDYRIGEAILGGFNGMPGLPTLTFWTPSTQSYQLNIAELLVFAICVATVLYILIMVLSASRFGQILSGIRDNENRMELLGYDIRFWKWLAFVVSGAIAGIGGGLFAAWGTFTNPSVFSLTQAAMVIIWVMVGGRTSFAGAFIGVAVVQLVADQADKVVAQQTPLILGVMLILTIFVLPNGIIPTATKVLARLYSHVTDGKRSSAQEVDDLNVPKTDAMRENNREESNPVMKAASGYRGLLTTKNIKKSFGGVSVLQSASLTFEDSPVHAIIGPNGAGKSTFFNAITGRFKVDGGRVVLNGEDITNLMVFQRARRGLGIKTQVPSIFPDMTVRDNVDLALRKVPKTERMERVVYVLKMVQLYSKEYQLASMLSHGEQQWLEIAMVLAQNPSVILLDEPVAGMTRDEKSKTLRLIETLSSCHRIIVVEHDMAFVRGLRAPVAMLHQGKVFRIGSFEEVCEDQQVIDIYLGRHHHAHSS